MTASGCVLYVIAPGRLSLDIQFEHAQTDALERKLPFAVVACVPAIDYTHKLKQLQAIEKTLAAYDIPLIVLVGEETTVISSIIKHANPVKVYGQSIESDQTEIKIYHHPFEWPGIVIKTDELKKIVDKNEYMC